MNRIEEVHACIVKLLLFLRQKTRNELYPELDIKTTLLELITYLEEWEDLRRRKR